MTPWTAACQAPLPSTISLSLLKLTSIELVMPSIHLILCHPLFLLPSIFPASGSFPMSQLFASGRGRGILFLRLHFSPEILNEHIRCGVWCASCLSTHVPETAPCSPNNPSIFSLPRPPLWLLWGHVIYLNQWSMSRSNQLKPLKFGASAVTAADHSLARHGFPSCNSC